MESYVHLLTQPFWGGESSDFYMPLMNLILFSPLIWNYELFLRLPLKSTNICFKCNFLHFFYRPSKWKFGWLFSSVRDFSTKWWWWVVTLAERIVLFRWGHGPIHLTWLCRLCMWVFLPFPFSVIQEHVIKHVID